MLLPGERRRTKVINVLLPGDRRRTKVKGILLLERILLKNTVTGGTLQGESFKRKLISFVRSENYYTKSIIFLKRKRGSAAIGNTSYETYDINKVLLPGKYYRRKP